jgi:hypothetical protein
MSLPTALSDSNNRHPHDTTTIGSNTNIFPLLADEPPQPLEKIDKNPEKRGFDKDPQPPPSQFPAMTPLPLHSLEQSHISNPFPTPTQNNVNGSYFEDVLSITDGHIDSYVLSLQEIQPPLTRTLSSVSESHNFRIAGGDAFGGAGMGMGDGGGNFGSKNGVENKNGDSFHYSVSEVGLNLSNLVEKNSTNFQHAITQKSGSKIDQVESNEKTRPDWLTFGPKPTPITTNPVTITNINNQKDVDEKKEQNSPRPFSGAVFSSSLQNNGRNVKSEGKNIDSVPEKGILDIFEGLQDLIPNVLNEIKDNHDMMHNDNNKYDINPKADLQGEVVRVGNNFDSFEKFEKHEEQNQNQIFDLLGSFTPQHYIKHSITTPLTNTNDNIENFIDSLIQGQYLNQNSNLPEMTTPSPLQTIPHAQFPPKDTQLSLQNTQTPPVTPTAPIIPYFDDIFTQLSSHGQDVLEKSQISPTLPYFSTKQPQLSPKIVQRLDFTENKQFGSFLSDHCDYQDGAGNNSPLNTQKHSNPVLNTQKHSNTQKDSNSPLSLFESISTPHSTEPKSNHSQRARQHDYLPHSEQSIQQSHSNENNVKRTVLNTHNQGEFLKYKAAYEEIEYYRNEYQNDQRELQKVIFEFEREKEKMKLEFEKKKQDYSLAFSTLSEKEEQFYHGQLQLEQMYNNLIVKQLELEQKEQKIKNELKIVISVIQKTCQELNTKDINYNALLSIKTELENHHQLLQFEVQALQLTISEEKKSYFESLTQLYKQVENYEGSIVPGLKKRVNEVEIEYEDIKRDLKIVERENGELKVEFGRMENEFKFELLKLEDKNQNLKDKNEKLEEQNGEKNGELLSVKKTLESTLESLNRCKDKVNNYQNVVIPQLQLKEDVLIKKIQKNEMLWEEKYQKNNFFWEEKYSQLKNNFEKFELKLSQVEGLFSKLELKHSNDIKKYKMEVETHLIRIKSLENDNMRHYNDYNDLVNEKTQKEVEIKQNYDKILTENEKISQNLIKNYKNSIIDLQNRFNITESQLLDKIDQLGAKNNELIEINGDLVEKKAIFETKILNLEKIIDQNTQTNISIEKKYHKSCSDLEQNWSQSYSNLEENHEKSLLLVQSLQNSLETLTHDHNAVILENNNIKSQLQSSNLNVKELNTMVKSLENELKHQDVEFQEEKGRWEVVLEEKNKEIMGKDGDLIDLKAKFDQKCIEFDALQRRLDEIVGNGDDNYRDSVQNDLLKKAEKDFAQNEANYISEITKLEEKLDDKQLYIDTITERCNQLQKLLSDPQIVKKVPEFGTFEKFDQLGDTVSPLWDQETGLGEKLGKNLDETVVSTAFVAADIMDKDSIIRALEDELVGIKEELGKVKGLNDDLNNQNGILIEKNEELIKNNEKMIKKNQNKFDELNNLNKIIKIQNEKYLQENSNLKSQISTLSQIQSPSTNPPPIPHSTQLTPDNDSNAMVMALTKQLTIYIQLTKELSVLDFSLAYPGLSDPVANDNNITVSGNSKNQGKGDNEIMDETINTKVISKAKISTAATMANAEALKTLVYRHVEENKQIKEQHAALNEYLLSLQTIHKEAIQRINLDNLTKLQELESYYKALMVSKDAEYQRELGGVKEGVEKENVKFQTISKHIQKSYQEQYQALQFARNEIKNYTDRIRLLENELESVKMLFSDEIKKNKLNSANNHNNNNNNSLLLIDHNNSSIDISDLTEESGGMTTVVEPSTDIIKKNENNENAFLNNQLGNITPQDGYQIPGLLEEYDASTLQFNISTLKDYVTSLHRLLSQSSSYQNELLAKIDDLAAQNNTFKSSMSTIMSKFEKKHSESTGNNSDPQQSWLGWLVGTPTVGSNQTTGTNYPVSNQANLDPVQASVQAHINGNNHGNSHTSGFSTPIKQGNKGKVVRGQENGENGRNGRNSNSFDEKDHNVSNEFDNGLKLVNKILVLEEKVVYFDARVKVLDNTVSELKKHIFDINTLCDCYQDIIQRLFTLIIYYHPDLIKFFNILGDCDDNDNLKKNKNSGNIPLSQQKAQEDILLKFISLVFHLKYDPTHPIEYIDSTIEPSSQSTYKIDQVNQNSPQYPPRAEQTIGIDNNNTKNHQNNQNNNSNDDDNNNNNNIKNSDKNYNNSQNNGWLSMFSGLWGNNTTPQHVEQVGLTTLTNIPHNEHIIHDTLFHPQSIILPSNDALPSLSWVELIYLRSVLINFTCYGHIEGLFAALQLLGIEVVQNQQENIVNKRNNDFHLDRSKLLTIFKKDLIPPQCVTKDKFEFLQKKFHLPPFHSNLYLPSIVQSQSGEIAGSIVNFDSQDRGNGHDGDDKPLIVGDNKKPLPTLISKQILSSVFTPTAPKKQPFSTQQEYIMREQGDYTHNRIDSMDFDDSKGNFTENVMIITELSRNHSNSSIQPDSDIDYIDYTIGLDDELP